MDNAKFSVFVFLNVGYTTCDQLVRVLTQYAYTEDNCDYTLIHCVLFNSDAEVTNGGRLYHLHINDIFRVPRNILLRRVQAVIEVIKGLPEQYTTPLNLNLLNSVLYN